MSDSDPRNKTAYPSIRESVSQSVKTQFIEAARRVSQPKKLPRAIIDEMREGIQNA